MRRIKKLYRGKIYAVRPDGTFPTDMVTIIGLDNRLLGFEAFDEIKDDLPDEVLPDVEYWITELIKSERFPDGFLTSRQVTIEEWYKFDPMV